MNSESNDKKRNTWPGSKIGVGIEFGLSLYSGCARQGEIEMRSNRGVR